LVLSIVGVEENVVNCLDALKRSLPVDIDLADGPALIGDLVMIIALCFRREFSECFAEESHFTRKVVKVGFEGIILDGEI
jgi:hypothetical protein